jgi:hypothetical protein
LLSLQESVLIEKDKVIVKKLLADPSAVCSKSLRYALNRWLSGHDLKGMGYISVAYFTVPGKLDVH